MVTDSPVRSMSAKIRLSLFLTSVLVTVLLTQVSLRAVCIDCTSLDGVQTSSAATALLHELHEGLG